MLNGEAGVDGLSHETLLIAHQLTDKTWRRTIMNRTIWIQHLEVELDITYRNVLTLSLDRIVINGTLDMSLDALMVDTTDECMCVAYFTSI